MITRTILAGFALSVSLVGSTAQAQGAHPERVNVNVSAEQARQGQSRQVESSVLSAGQSNQRRTTGTLLTSAPIFLLPDTTREPLRVGRQGSQVAVLEQVDGWLTIQFQDPQFGIRTGYVESRHVRVAQPPSASEPVDVSIRDGAEASPVTAPAVSETRLVQPARPQRSTTAAQRAEDMVPRSTSTGFFIGFGLEGNGLVPTGNGFASATESGAGGGLVIGYGFNPRWSLYGTFSGASMESVDFVGNYGLGHFDLGTRIHFLAGEHRVVPFIQAGLSGRAMSADFASGFRTTRITASGAGLAFGGGLNAHFTPRFAFSGGVTWMVGDFTKYEVNGVDIGGSSMGATSARVHLGLIWFAKAP